MACFVFSLPVVSSKKGRTSTSPCIDTGNRLWPRISYGQSVVHFQGEEELRSLDAGEEVCRPLPARQTGRGLSQVKKSCMQAGNFYPRNFFDKVLSAILPKLSSFFSQIRLPLQDSSSSAKLQPPHERQEEWRDRLLRSELFGETKNSPAVLPSLKIKNATPPWQLHVKA